MADQKPTSTFYRNLGGINQKASEYSIDKAQFLNLSNLDFDTPNALSKRTGSTQAIGLNTSGPINSLFEFIKLDGSSYVIAGDNTAMWYKTGTSLTVLDSGWTNGQPADMLTFLNKVWMANGQNYKFWTGSTLLNAGIKTPLEFNGNWQALTDDASYILIAGSTHIGSNISTLSLCIVGVWLAYSPVRGDGYVSPINVLKSAKQVIGYTTSEFLMGYTSGIEYFAPNADFAGGFGCFSGFSVAPGVTALSIWIARDRIIGKGTALSGTTWPIYSFSEAATGESSLAYGYNTFSFGGIRSTWFKNQINPSADPTLFKLYTNIPVSQATISLTNLNWGSFIASNPQSLSYSFNFADTYTPKYVEINQNSMFLAGFSNAPSTIWFSDLGQPETIQPDSFFEVRTNDGDRILATKTYANQLIVMKENSFHKVIGDSPENFELVEVSTRYGCLSNKTVIEYEQKLLWLDKKGILEYNGANYDIISTPVEDIFRRMNVEAAKEKAVAVHEIYRNQVWFGIPVDGSTTNNMTVVYDYLVKAWTFFEGFNPASFALIKQDLTKGTVWRGDYSGMIYYHSASFLGDNGQAITCLVKPHWDKNKENETWIWRRFFLDVGTATGLTGRITGKLYSNYDNSTVQATFSMFQDAFQSRAEIGVVGKAVTTEFAHVSASLPLLINGYSWAKRFLRNV